MSTVLGNGPEYNIYVQQGTDIRRVGTLVNILELSDAVVKAQCAFPEYEVTVVEVKEVLHAVIHATFKPCQG